MFRIALATLTALVSLTLLPLPAPAADADKAQEVFDSLFGADLKKVLAARDTAGEAALAAKMLEAARSADGQPAFQTLLCLKAAELGILDPKGYDTAQAAADFLAEKVPEKAAAAREIVMSIHQKRFESARSDDRFEAAQVFLSDILVVAAAKAKAGDIDDAVKRCRQAQTVLATLRAPLPEGLDALAKRAADLMKAAGRVTILKGNLKSETTAKAAREELVRLFLVDLDSPEEAAKYLDDSSDPLLRKYIPALSRPINEVPELACLELGDWLRIQADAAATTGKAGLLRRALSYYDRFLTLHTTVDLDRTKADLAMKKVQADLEKLGEAAASNTGLWIDLLKLLSTPKDYLLPRSSWEHVDAGWTGTGGPSGGKIQAAIVPQGDYELEIKFTKTAKDRTSNNGVWIHLPVPDASKAGCMLHRRRREQHDRRIRTDQRRSARMNPSSARFSLDDNRSYTLQVKVTLAGDQVTMAAAIDSRPIVKWSGSPDALSVWSMWQMPQPKCVGLAAGANTTVTFTSARLRMTSGKAIPLEKYTAPGATTPAATATSPGKSPPGPPMPPKTGVIRLVPGG